MARNMIIRKRNAENAGIYAGTDRPCRTHGNRIPADVKEQIFEYANLIGEEEKVRTLVRNLQMQSIRQMKIK